MRFFAELQRRGRSQFGVRSFCDGKARGDVVLFYKKFKIFFKKFLKWVLTRGKMCRIMYLGTKRRGNEWRPLAED